MTTNTGTATNTQPVTQTNGTVKPRSTLIEALKLAGQCVTAAGGAQAPSGGECTLTAKMGNKANVAIKGTQVQVSRTADGVWSCKVRGLSTAGNAKNGWKDKFIPSGCIKANSNSSNADSGWI